MRLSTLWTQLTTAEREALAKSVDTDPGYLHQLATRWRGKSASVKFITRLAAADARLTVQDMVEEFAEEWTPPVKSEG
jgi:hypothetical protein